MPSGVDYFGYMEGLGCPEFDPSMTLGCGYMECMRIAFLRSLSIPRVIHKVSTRECITEAKKNVRAKRYHLVQLRVVAVWQADFGLFGAQRN
jgi:hypothetical protein